MPGGGGGMGWWQLGTVQYTCNHAKRKTPRNKFWAFAQNNPLKYRTVIKNFSYSIFQKQGFWTPQRITRRLLKNKIGFCEDMTVKVTYFFIISQHCFACISIDTYTHLANQNFLRYLLIWWVTNLWTSCFINLYWIAVT